MCSFVAVAIGDDDDNDDDNDDNGNDYDNEDNDGVCVCVCVCMCVYVCVCVCNLYQTRCKISCKPKCDYFTTKTKIYDSWHQMGIEEGWGRVCKYS